MRRGAVRERRAGAGGEKLLGFLHTGQVFASTPTAAEFDRTAKFVDKLGVNVDVTELRDAYFGTKVLCPDAYAGCVRLLTIFAVQLGLLASQRMERERLAEPP